MPMMPEPDDSPPSADAGDGPTGRLSARDAAERVACEAHTPRSAARRGAVEGTAKDAEGRWWVDPDGVRRWVRTLRSQGRHAAAPVRNPSWRGKGRILTDR